MYDDVISLIEDRSPYDESMLHNTFHIVTWTARGEVWSDMYDFELILFIEIVNFLDV